jgi:hypothetical protein
MMQFKKWDVYVFGFGPFSLVIVWIHYCNRNFEISSTVHIEIVKAIDITSSYTHLLEVPGYVCNRFSEFFLQEKKDRLKSCILFEDHKRSFVPTDYFSAIIKYKR